MDEYITGSEGSVCQDPGVEDAASMQIKADIVRRISAVMKEKNLTQQTVSELTGIPQGRISRILNGHFRGVSEYKLLECLSKLGNNIEIRVIPASRPGQIVFA